MSKEIEERKISPVALRLLWQMTTKNESADELKRCQNAWNDLAVNLMTIKPILESYNIWQHILMLRRNALDKGIVPSEKTFLAYLRDDFNDLYSEYKAMEDEDQEPHKIEEICIYAEEQEKKFQLCKAMESATKTLSERGIEEAWNGLNHYIINSPINSELEVVDFADASVWDDIDNTLETTITANESGTLNIKTGIACIDDNKTWFQRKELVGVLGQGGGYKSTFVRTLAYNCAKQGYKILYFPLETRIESEVQNFVIQHTLRNRPASTLDRIDCKNGTLTRNGIAHKDFKWGISDLKNLSAEGKIIMPTFVDFTERSTWAGIRKEIYRHVRQEKIDIVIIDYLTLISKDGAKDPRTYIEDVMIDLAKLCKTEGVAVITPLQTGRDVKKKVMASKKFDNEDIYMYSEAEKSFDIIYTLYQGPYFEEVAVEDRNGEIIPGKTKTITEEMLDDEIWVATCKTRSVPPIKDPEPMCIVRKTYLKSGHPNILRELEDIEMADDCGEL